MPIGAAKRLKSQQASQKNLDKASNARSLFVKQQKPTPASSSSARGKTEPLLQRASLTMLPRRN